jgi:WD40-like Beta Propeller Repeat
MKRSSRRLTRLFVAACVVLITLTGNAQVQSVKISPNRLREGDGKTRNILIEAAVAEGALVNISVSYSADPQSAPVDFTPKFVVQDNGPEDRDSQKGNIRLLLPRAFDQLGVYTIVVEGQTFKVVHERNNSSYLRQFAEWLVSGAGDGERRGKGRSALERILDASKTSRQDNFAIWTAPLPPVGESIKKGSLTVKINAAVMPAWSPKGNDLACSAWRNGRWVIAAYTIKPDGDGIESWQWNQQKDKSSDFSPAWSPNGDAIAFVRLNEDQKSDIWILELDKNLRPAREMKATSFGNVHAVLGWDKDLGLLFETKTGTRQIWALKPATGTAKASPTPLSDDYGFVSAGAPLRQTVIYAEENDSPPPVSVIHEVNSSKKDWTLLTGDRCSYRWPSISHDEKWIALESDCPR